MYVRACPPGMREIVGVAIRGWAGMQTGRFDNSHNSSSIQQTGPRDRGQKNKQSRDVTSRTRKLKSPMSLISPITSLALLRAPPSQGRSRATPWIGLRLGSHESNSQNSQSMGGGGRCAWVVSCLWCGLCRRPGEAERGKVPVSVFAPAPSRPSALLTPCLQVFWVPSLCELREASCFFTHSSCRVDHGHGHGPGPGPGLC